jgi:hypothetical protein
MIVANYHLWVAHGSGKSHYYCPHRADIFTGPPTIIYHNAKQVKPHHARPCKAMHKLAERMLLPDGNCDLRNFRRSPTEGSGVVSSLTGAIRWRDKEFVLDWYFRIINGRSICHSRHGVDPCMYQHFVRLSAALA